MVDHPVELFTDGACKGNPGPGGWGVVVVAGGQRRTLCGGEPETTNNRMELKAVIEGLAVLPPGTRVTITTDSKYVQDGMKSWIHGWKRNGWRTSDKKPVKNVDLWKALDEAVSAHQVSWRWVKGHSGHPMNELADQLANEGVNGALRGDSDPGLFGAPAPPAPPEAPPALYRGDLRVLRLEISRAGIGTRVVLEATTLPAPGSTAARLRFDFGGAEGLRLARPLELPWDVPGLEVLELDGEDPGKARYQVRSREIGGLSLACRGFAKEELPPA